jgi:flagellar biosynthetic protein FliR
MDLEGSLDPALFGFLLALARVSAVVMLMPGIGENWVPPRARLGIAFGLALIVAGSVGVPQSLPETFSARTGAVIAETLTGVLIGGTMRFFLAAPAIAGQTTSQLSSLSNIFIAAGMPMDSSSVLSTWFIVGAIMFIFVSGLHYLMIETIAFSYAIIPAGEVPILGDAARHAAATFAQVFALGVRLAVPLIILSFIFNMGVGLLTKMLPSLPVFFFAMPISILGSFYVLAHAIAPLLLAFRGAFAAWLSQPLGV